MDHPFPSFKFPPLSEVSIGIQFEPLERLRIPHFGAFWERLRADFPLTAHALPIANQDGSVQFDPGTNLVLPRVWFINLTDSRLIQLQTNRYNFNWRKRDDAESYPRHPEIVDKFFHYLGALKEFLAEADIGLIQPTVTELTYVNTFEQGKEWASAEDISNIIRDFPWEKQDDRFLPNPQELNWAAVFSLPDNQGRLDVKLNPAQRNRDGQSVLLFELTASNEVHGQAREVTESWYELAHEWIVKSFADLTKREAQEKYWGREK